MGRITGSALAAAAACMATLGSAPAGAQWGAEASAAKQGFTFPAQAPVRVLVFRPDVRVGAQSTGGVETADADWTAAARTNLANALQTALAARAITVKAMPEPDAGGDDATLLADYRALFRAVVSAVVEHKLFAGNRLPTKKATFNWTLGPGVARLGALGGGDYGLFFYSSDSYGSAGRKAAQIVGLMLGVGLTSGSHVGYAGLVDMTTGELVWINADLAMGGDVRDPAGAAKRVAQLLEDFPQRAGAGRP